MTLATIERNTHVARRVDVREHFAIGNQYENRVLLPGLAKPLMQFMVKQVERRRQSNAAKSINHFLFDGLGGLCRKIKEGAASWEALRIIYNYEDQGSFVDRFWIRHMRNAQAVRNRKRIIVSELHDQCVDVIARKGTVKIISLASGSAQAVFEALKGLPPESIEVLLIDFDPAAGPYALEMARQCGLESRVNFKQGNLLKFDRAIMIGNFKPDIIEMAGLLDYLGDDKAVKLMQKIYAVLPEGGQFVTCHIHDNTERDFMTQVIEWGRDDGKQQPMLYRTRQELVELVREAGFTMMTVFVEPHHIHSVVVAKKI
jgi:hypothetical protein